MNLTDQKTSMYIPAKEAAKLVNYSPDYVARLAREGKIEAKRIDRQWYVDRNAIKLFVLLQDDLKRRRQQELKAQRLRERAIAESSVTDSVALSGGAMAREALATTVVTSLAIAIVAVLGVTAFESKLSLREIGNFVATAVIEVPATLSASVLEVWPDRTIAENTIKPLSETEAGEELRELPVVNASGTLLLQLEEGESPAALFSDEVEYEAASGTGILHPVFRNGQKGDVFPFWSVTKNQN